MTNKGKPGYKNTLLGWIPQEWEIRELKDIVSKPIVYGIVQAGPHIENGIPYIKSTDVGGEINTKSLGRTSLAIAMKYKRSEVLPGDIVFSLRGNIGEISLVPQHLPVANLTQGTARVSVHKSLDTQFVYYSLQSPAVVKSISYKSKGSTFKEISLEQLRKICLPIPSWQDQKKIAAILSTWDQAIRGTQLLIAELQHRNKGLRQQLLTGKNRLKVYNKPWREIHLAEAFNERNETGFVNLNLLSVGALGVYPQSQSEKRDTSNSDKARYKRICPGDIGYNTMRMWQGRSALSSLEGIVSPAYTIVTPKEGQHSEFYAYLFKLPSVVNKFFRNSQGLVEDTLNCKFKDFAIVKVEVPEYEEQVAIANVLTTAQAEIKSYEQKLNVLQQQKKGLMQKLLTGEVRVKID